jgi:hypothetical protein
MTYIGERNRNRAVAFPETSKISLKNTLKMVENEQKGGSLSTLNRSKGREKHLISRI